MSHLPLDPQSEWAGLLLGSLADAGVRDVVLSPGSRSTPFVLAAARCPALRLHPVVDERSAAFFALGRAKATGEPSLLLCTSGTAAAHYLPAVIEASLSFTPLLVLTADRPLELQDCGAPQTIDQVKLFGAHVRWFAEAGTPDGRGVALNALRRLAAQAVATARGPVPGPVHVNARAHKPLEPRAAATEEEQALACRARELRAAPPLRVAAVAPPAPDAEAVAAIAAACAHAPRGLLVCGPAALAQSAARREVARLSARTGYPILAEAASQLRFGLDPAEGTTVCDAFDLLLRVERFRRAHAPQVVLQIGGTPTSAAYERYLAEHPSVERHVIAAQGWNDPWSSARSILRADVGAAARAIASAVSWRGPGGWAGRFASASRVAWTALSRLFDEAPLGEGEVARAVTAHVAPGGVLAIGNSLPIRLVDACCPATTARCGVSSQRGANGIDGLVSGAAGVAASGVPVTLLLGDLSLLHDLGGLHVAARAAVPLSIVVIQNQGGRIFEQLPVASAATAETLDWFTMPHELSFAPAAALFGIPYRRAATSAELALALDEASGRAGCSLIEAVVPPHGAAAFFAALPARVEGALDAAGLLEGAP